MWFRVSGAREALPPTAPTPVCMHLFIHTLLIDLERDRPAIQPMAPTLVFIHLFIHTLFIHLDK